MDNERRFWQLYRRERQKAGPFTDQLSSAQIAHIARTARKHLDEEEKKRPK